MRRCRSATDLVAATCTTCNQYFPMAVLDAADIARMPFLDPAAEASVQARASTEMRGVSEDAELAELLAAVGEDDELVQQVL
ncbi:hypothetical protein OFM36_32200, partial [Escherichia coli]|nr:hypothetical protein [Escherichia coli]